MMFDLQDHCAGGPLMLADHASGTAVVAVGDGTMTIVVSAAVVAAAGVFDTVVFEAGVYE